MRLNIEMKKEIYEALKEMAKREGRSISDVVRVLVIEWLEQKGRSSAVAIERKVALH